MKRDQAETHWIDFTVGEGKRNKMNTTNKKLKLVAQDCNFKESVCPACARFFF